MSFEIGEYVVYGTVGICKISGIEKRTFDGVNEYEYYKLTPTSSEASNYYVPKNSETIKIRSLLSKDEIYSLINTMPDAEPIWCDNTNERKNMYSKLLKSDNYTKIICMIKGLYNQQAKRISMGRKLSSADEQTMKTAEKMMYQEFGFVLGISIDEVPKFLLSKIEGAK